jgi:hypothetical protein
LLAGVSVPASAESRDLRSNDSLLTQIATRTGGRIHPFPGRGPAVDLFSREGLPTSQSSHPIQDLLITALIAITILDVAVRRIAWDYPALKRLASTTARHIRQFTLSSHHPATAAAATLAALRHRDRPVVPEIASPSPSPGAPGEGRGAGSAPRTPNNHTIAPTETPSKCRAQPTSATSPLFDAKRRAQQQNNRERNG